ncbi:MAG: acetyl-CoA carboxylase biotin carboxylase subunit [Thermoplasmatota archaeon]
MFRKLLVANRGEIAVRVIRAARELGLRTVAVYSEVDRDSLGVRMADEAVLIGAAPARESYLVQERIIEAAAKTGAEAIHPGYGFLSENADFVRKCDAAGIIFVGPPAKAMDLLGDKVEAKRLARTAGVPVAPASDGPVTDVEEAKRIADGIGYPVLVKAAHGGGGRGQRVAWKREELGEAMEAAAREAEASFGRGEVFLEKFIESPRHVEFQVLADNHGHVIHLGERECSIQRRNQKLIEESPSNVLTPETRAEAGARVVDLAKRAGYTNAGTMEFLWKDGKLYFLEMNTRLQVEHPVTEMVTNVDLVRWQLRIAAGEHLAIKQEDVVLRGHAMEARVNAEDPWSSFRPTPGLVTSYRPPGGPGTRVDDYLRQGFAIPDAYDSLVAKVIAWGPSRDLSIARLRRALGEFEIGGITTNIPFHLRLFDNADFQRGAIHTNFLRDSGILASFETEAKDRAEDARRIAAAIAATLAQEPGGIRAAEHRLRVRRAAEKPSGTPSSGWLMSARRSHLRGLRG